MNRRITLCGFYRESALAFLFLTRLKSERKTNPDKKRRVVMKFTGILLWLAIMLAFQMPINVQAFGCPKSFDEAQAAIDKVKGDMGGEMSKMMKKEDMALVHSLLDDAKIRLAGAKHNHEKPQGRYDHARAIAKAKAAKGYAEAADIYHWALMKKMK